MAPSLTASSDLELKYSADFNTLNLLPKNWRPGRGLFDLPRELRETIYRLVLVRPAVWDKRHQPGCWFHARYADAAAEHPPFVQHESHYIVSTKTWYAESADLQRCEALCGHRDVNLTALLCVSKQLHADAAPLYWAHKWVCFSSYHAFLTTLSSLSDEQCRRIRRLSLQSLECWPNDAGAEWRQWRRAEVFAALDRCTHLQDVELPQPVLAAWLADESRQIATRMPALRTATALHTWVHYLADPVPSTTEEMVYLVGARQSQRTVACYAHDGHRSGKSDLEGDVPSVSRTSPTTCAACRARRQSSRAAAKALVSFSYNRYYPKQTLQTAVAAHLAEHEPTHPAEEAEGDGTTARPYTFPLVHEGHEYDVTIWGLPRLSRAARESRAAEKKLQELKARIKPRTHPTVQVVAGLMDRAEEDSVAMQARKKERRPRKGKTEAEADGGAASRENVLRERRERRELREKEEREEKAQKRAGSRAERKESEKALKEQRKALRTRKGKTMGSSG